MKYSINPYNVLNTNRDVPRVSAAATWVANLIFAGGTTTVLTATQLAVGYGAVVVAAGAVTYAVVDALLPKPVKGTKGLLTNIREAAAPADIVYGQVRKGGVVTYLESTGSSNNFLHMFITLAGHEVEEIGDIYINDKKATFGTLLLSEYVLDAADGPDIDTYNAKILIKKFTGAANQNIYNTLNSDPYMTLGSTGPNIPSTFTGKGVACLYVRLTYDKDVFTQGIPTFTAVVKGKKVKNLSGVEQTHPASANPALVIRDYLLNSYGLDTSEDTIDATSFGVAVNDCDDDITLSAEYGGGTQKRYTIDGVLSTSTSIQNNLNELVSACGGTLFYSGGKFKLVAGVYSSSVKTLTLEDLRSEITVSTRVSRRDNFNSVSGNFVNKDDDYTVADYETVTSTTFLEEDGGLKNPLELDFTLINDHARAQRLAKLALYRAREQMTVQAEFGLEAFDLEVGDTIALPLERYGWDNISGMPDGKEFEVVEWGLKVGEDAGDLRVMLTLRETSSAAFDWNAEETALISNNTSLISSQDVPAVTLGSPVAGNTQNSDGTAIPFIDFSWSTASPEFIDRYDFEWSSDGGTTYNTITTSGTLYRLSPTETGVTYLYRVTPYNNNGVAGTTVSGATGVATVADSTTPNSPTGVSVAGGYRTTTVTWTEPTQNTDASTLTDLKYYRVYRGTTSNPTTEVGVVYSNRFTDGGLLDNTTYYYRIKAVDRTGNESAFSLEGSGVTNPELVDGAPGDDGARGAGRWYVSVTSLPTTSSAADTEFTADIGDPVDGDQAWFYTGTISNPTGQTVWIYAAGTDTWTEQEEFIDGNLIVSGSITGDRIAANQTITSPTISSGTIEAGTVKGGNLLNDSNQTSGNTTKGAYMNLTAGTFLFGEAAVDGEFIKWDGSTLNISGSAISATNLAGDLTGNVTGNVDGNVTGNAGAAGDVPLNATDGGNTVELTAGDASANITFAGGAGVSVNAVPTANNDTITISSNINQNNAADQVVQGTGNVTVNVSGNTYTVSANDSIGNLNNVTSNNALISFDNTNDAVSFNGNTPGSGNLRNSNVTLGNLASSNVTLGNLASDNTTLGNLASANESPAPTANTHGGFKTGGQVAYNTTNDTANVNSINYTNQVNAKPTLGSLADQDSVSYTNEVNDKPTIPSGNLANLNTVNLANNVSGTLAEGSLPNTIGKNAGTGISINATNGAINTNITQNNTTGNLNAVDLTISETTDGNIAKIESSAGNDVELSVANENLLTLNKNTNLQRMDLVFNGNTPGSGNLRNLNTVNLANNVSGTLAEASLPNTIGKNAGTGISINATNGAINTNITQNNTTGNLNAVNLGVNDDAGNTGIDITSSAGNNVTMDVNNNLFSLNANATNRAISLSFNGNTPGSGNFRNLNALNYNVLNDLPTLGNLASSNVTLGNLASSNAVVGTGNFRNLNSLSTLTGASTVNGTLDVNGNSITLGTNGLTTFTDNGNNTTLARSTGNVNIDGNISGNAANATNVNVDATVVDESLYLTGVDGQTNAERIEAATNITFNPANSVISANITGQAGNIASQGNLATDNTVLGNLATSNTVLGNLAESNTVLGNFATLNDLNNINGNAANATNVDVDATVVDESLYLAAVDGQTNAERIEAPTNIRVNPANSSITANITGQAATIASQGNLATSNAVVGTGNLRNLNTVNLANNVSGTLAEGSLPNNIGKNAGTGISINATNGAINSNITQNNANGNVTSVNATGNGLINGGNANARTIAHADTSTVTNVGSTGATTTALVAGVSLDDFGHVTGGATINLGQLADLPNQNTSTPSLAVTNTGAINIVADAITAETISAGAVEAQALTAQTLNAAQATIGTAQIDALTAASAQITNLNAGDITAANIDTNVLNSQQVVAGRSLQVGNLNLDANAKPASGAGMFVVGAANAGGAGNTAGDVAFGDTSQYVSWDTSTGTLTVQGSITNLTQARLDGLAGSWIAITEDVTDLSNSTAFIEGAGIYRCIMVAGGGAGGGSSRSRACTGGGASGIAFWTLDWDGNTSIGVDLGTGGASGERVSGGAGNASTFSVGGTTRITVNGGAGGLGGDDALYNAARSGGAGGNASLTSSHSSISSTVFRSGGAGGNNNVGGGECCFATGGGGVDFLGNGDTSAGNVTKGSSSFEFLSTGGGSPFGPSPSVNGGTSSSVKVGSSSSATGNDVGISEVLLNTGGTNSTQEAGTETLGPYLGNVVDGKSGYIITNSNGGIEVGNSLGIAGGGSGASSGNDFTSILRAGNGTIFGGGGGIAAYGASVNVYANEGVRGGNGGLGAGGGAACGANTGAQQQGGDGGGGALFVLKL